jgi:predicted metal-dependent hydrolase
MAFKEFALNDSQSVVIYKRRSSHSLRLSITATGQVRVTIPLWAPYRSGLEFARSRQAWIATNQQPIHALSNGQPIGKAHHLRFIADTTATKTTSRVTGSEIIIRYPTDLYEQHKTVQKLALSASLRALKNQAEQLLPQRLQSLAEQHSLRYKSVAVRQLKSRWGSCDQTGHIILNIYLLQLPWDLIDYVLLHELTHTQIMRHGPDFWQAMERLLPAAKQRRKEIKNYQPVFSSVPPQSMA